MLIETVTLAAAIVVAFIVIRVFNSAIHLTVNAIVGILLLIVAKTILGFEIAITAMAIVVCALGGVLGAFAIIVLNHLGIAFL